MLPLKPVRQNGKNGIKTTSQIADLLPVLGTMSSPGRHCLLYPIAAYMVVWRKNARGRGIASALLKALIKESEKSGIWTLQAGIFPENIASLRLHLKCGFREVGLRKNLGKLNGIWRDVLLLERRSDRVGTK
jgi:hypothetical protein